MSIQCYIKVWIAFSCLLAGLESFAAAAEGPPITRCLDALKLSPEEAALRRNVRVSGIVTCYVPGSGLCFVQDASAGIYVQPSPWLKELNAGDRVEVSGMTAPGLFSPIIENATIKRLGSGTLPPAKAVAIEELKSGRMDSQWVELSGVVQIQEQRPDHQYLQLWTGGTHAEILIFTEANLRDLVDRKIRVRGVAGTFYAQQRLTGFGLLVPNVDQVSAGDPPVELFSRPVRPVNNLAWYSLEGSLDHRIHLKGSVTFVRPPDLFFIKDASGALAVESSEKFELKPGDEVEVAGFIRDAATNPWLARAMVRVLGHKESVPPAAVSLKQLESREYLSRVVQISGVVAEVSSAEKGPHRAVITDQGEVIMANSSNPLARSLKGCRVKVSGAWSASGGGAPELLIESSKEIEIVARPVSAGTVEQHARVLAVAAAGFGMAVLAGIWALAMKYKIRKTTEEGNLMKKQLANARFELEQMIDNRERLGRDLHDHIIQSIYAVGLSLEDCRGLVQKEPEKVASRLKTATIDINAVIGELRNVITGLEGSALKPKELRTALKSLALTMGQENSSRIRVELEQEALEALTSGQATEMLYIAREAMSNSVRHGGATTSVISLRLIEGGARFSIEDNGKGFKIEEKRDHGLGLRNMSKRAENLSASFKIDSQEGTGTRIVLDIPIQKQHFSTNESHSRFDR